MKILIDDGMQIKIGTGIGKYSLYLFNELKKNKDIQIELSEYKASSNNRIKERVKYLKFINSRCFREVSENYDIIHFTNYTMPFKKTKGVKYVVTIHDLVSFLYPETLPRIYRLYNQIMIKNSLKQADIIITDSESVKKEIKQLFPHSKAKIVAIYNGVFDGIKKIEICSEYENNKLRDIVEYKKFFLFVGTIEKRKNVGIIIDAFIKLKDSTKETSEYKLVLAGRPGFGFEEFEEKVNSCKWKKDIIFTGYISNNDCNNLYNSAISFIFPSFYEGFGVPQLECMKCQIPIILSDIPTNREISREYGLFFKLDDIDELVNHMSNLVSGKYQYDKYNALAEEYIKEFSWNVIASRNESIYKSIID